MVKTGGVFFLLVLACIIASFQEKCGSALRFLGCF